MYEQYLRDPASVGEDWRRLFDNGKTGELPVIPLTRDEVVATPGSGERGVVPSAAPPSTTPPAPLPAGLTPITAPPARLVQTMPHSPPCPPPPSSPDTNFAPL